MRRGSRAAGWLVLGLLAGPAAAPPAADPEVLALSEALRIRVRSGRSVELEARLAGGDDLRAVARRYAGTERLLPALEAANPRGAVAEGWVRLPLALLADEYRALVLLHLFPRDRLERGDWIHAVRAAALPLYDEGLWQVAEWFTGHGARFADLMAANGLASPELSAGQEIRVPAALLHPALGALAVPAAPPLHYGKDAAGPFAGYRMRAGEALYSAVVVRFTGRTLPDDVNAVAELVARRSGIADPRDIPVHYLVKIPEDLLEAEFLPPGHPRRRAVEQQRAEGEAELAREPVRPPPAGLRGVHVILDPGHGGRDLGTIQNGIWEHDYVYDVACRLRLLLERDTAARVFMTLEDAQTGCAPSESEPLRANRQGTVRSTPPFLAQGDGESSMAVHLRWYVSNAVFRQALRDGTEPDRVVFLSLHADARHPSTRGLMVYAPGAQHRAKSFGPTAASYQKFREVRESPRVRLTKHQRVRSEAVSRKLGGALAAAFGDAGLPVQPYRPVRSEIIRGKERWVPAVLRGNQVPASVLVELVNLSNRDDAALLADAADRQRMARALVAGLLAYFGERPPAPQAASR